MAGPRKGMAEKTPIARPRSLAENMSAMMPLGVSVCLLGNGPEVPAERIMARPALSTTHPELVIVELPNVPAKKRMTSRTLSDLAPHTPALKAVNGT